MRDSEPRSRAHRGLLFEYVLGVSLVVLGLLGMTVMQARLLVVGYSEFGTETVLDFWRGERRYDGDDARSLSASLRVCGDGLGRDVELDCWRDQVAALLPPRNASGETLPRHQLVVDGVARDVIVFGGGPGRTQGAGITVADAASGVAIWQARYAEQAGFDVATASYGHPLLTEAVGDQIAAVDGDLDGIIDRLYFGDAGGRLWRADLAGLPEGMPRSADHVTGEQPSLWRLAPIFSAGANVAELSGSSLHQRVFHARPDVVQARDPRGRYDAILIGTTGGGRSGVENWFYMIKDRGVTSGLPQAGDVLEHGQLRDLSDRCAAAEICEGGRSGLENGWRLRLAASGEAFTGHAVTAAGSVLFSTWTPLGIGCDGRHVLYAVSLRDARPTFRIDSTSERDPVAREIMEIVEKATRTQPCRLAGGTG